jgi:hypothetical protein
MDCRLLHANTSQARTVGGGDDEKGEMASSKFWVFSFLRERKYPKRYSQISISSIDSGNQSQQARKLIA